MTSKPTTNVSLTPVSEAGTKKCGDQNVLPIDILQRAAIEARGLAMDGAAEAKTGHLGLPLGCAELGAVLFGFALKFNPMDPNWINRDRFVLSAGHGANFLYDWLHLNGFDLTMDDLKAYRKIHSKTPGHPEFRCAPGVEATTGPLGQGVANAVGYAVSQKMAAARFNTEQHKIFDNHVVCLAGDGCMQEGISNEAAAFAGHNQLDNLILLYDFNNVTLDAPGPVSQSEDTGKRFEALGWEVQQCDGYDMRAMCCCFEIAKANTGKPQLIIVRTLCGKGIPEVSGTEKAHGEAGIKFIDEARKKLGLPEERFYVSPVTRSYFAQRAKKLEDEYNAWTKLYNEWGSANPNLKNELESFLKLRVPGDLLNQIPTFPSDGQPMATRKAGAEIIKHIAHQVPNFITGSADLGMSCSNIIPDGGHFSPDNFSGRNLHFGIREHAMAGIINGIAYDGIFRPSGSTFTTFSDYCRASLRLAALSRIPALFIFTHDSIGVGEDGPTHQPIEQVSALRLIPHMDVIRPADPEETAGAYTCAIQRRTGPTTLIFTRQNVPLLNEIPVDTRRQGVMHGGYIALRERGPLHAIVMSAGSELQLAMQAVHELGAEDSGVRVVSIPSFYRFAQQTVEYREEVLPTSCTARVAIEAGVPDLWWKYVGLHGKVVGLQRFGISGNGNQVMEALGLTKQTVLDALHSVLSAHEAEAQQKMKATSEFAPVSPDRMGSPTRTRSGVRV